MKPPLKACILKMLPDNKMVQAAKIAVGENPANLPSTTLTSKEPSLPGFLATITTKYWGAKGVDLGVAFLDTSSIDLKQKILYYMNLWGKNGKANVQFREATKSKAEVRITRVPGDGYWSYLGTDVLFIKSTNPTMNLDSFSLSTPEEDYKRVVCHETGHTLGFPHEHLRKAIVSRLDPNKTVAWFRQHYGWPEDMTRYNVLTPLNESDLIATEVADEESVMTYDLPAEITKDGREIKGGPIINKLDYKHIQTLYPSSAPMKRSKIVIEVTGEYKITQEDL